MHRAQHSIAPAAAASVASDDANTEFFRETLVATPSADDPMLRHLEVIVRWTDRLAQPQRVDLSTMIAGTPPELAALHAMRTDRGPLQQPLGRNAAIPRGATDLGDGTSSFVPPGGPTDRSWIFNNATGLITKICQPAGTCTASNRWLLSGIVAFATGGMPTAGEAASPGDASIGMTISVSLILPTPASVEPCVAEVLATRVNYHCALPLSPTLRWAGQIQFSGFARSSTVADATATNYKVCRYTPDDRNLTAIPTGETADNYNGRHPYAFRSVAGPQLNKNFLIISAGDGTTAFGCPDEDSSTLIQSNTWPHDPAS